MTYLVHQVHLHEHVYLRCIVPNKIRVYRGGLVDHFGHYGVPELYKKPDNRRRYAMYNMFYTKETGLLL